MIRSNQLSHLSFLLITSCLLVILSGCGQSPEEHEPVALDAPVCELEPELCEESCAGCPDQEVCFKQNGNCVAAGLEFNDNGDGNVDIFTPGCHQEYPVGQCPNNPKFFSGDACGRNQPNNLIEWTDSNCHGPSGDRSTFDCNAECLRLGLGNGTCMVVADACGAGNDSAVCKCDIAPPVP